MEIRIMPSAITALGNIHQNAYILAPYIESFYREIRNKDILLAYLVLPMIFNPKILPALNVIRSNSTIFTKFTDKSHLSGIDRSVREFKDITNTSLQILFELGVIELGVGRLINVGVDSIMSQAVDQKKVVAAKQLGKLLDAYDVRECYRFFGVKSL